MEIWGDEYMNFDDGFGYVCIGKRGYDTHSDLPDGACVDAWLDISCPIGCGGDDLPSDGYDLWI